MTKLTANDGQWKPGQSGNPKGRPAKSGFFQAMLREYGNQPMAVGGETFTHWEGLTVAVWQLATTGEVWLSGRRLVVENASEWATFIKWMVGQFASGQAVVDEPELVVRVVRTFNHRDAEDTVSQTGGFAQVSERD